MKIDYNPVTGKLKVRPSLGTIVAVGVTIAGIKIVADASEAVYITTLRKLHPKLEELVEDARDKVEKAKEAIQDEL